MMCHFQIYSSSEFHPLTQCICPAIHADSLSIYTGCLAARGENPRTPNPHSPRRPSNSVRPCLLSLQWCVGESKGYVDIMGLCQYHLHFLWFNDYWSKSFLLVGRHYSCRKYDDSAPFANKMIRLIVISTQDVSFSTSSFWCCEIIHFTNISKQWITITHANLHLSL